MITAEIARMTDAERLAYVQAQVHRLEEDTARALLGPDAQDIDVRRLVFGRELFMTLRLREWSV